jgi:hypothetical protein
MSEFSDAVAAAAADTPYTVVTTKRGFVVRLDVANAQWWGLYNRAGLRKTFRWRVTEHRNYFTIADRQVELRWRAGVPGLGGTLQGQSGRILTLQREKIWALSDRGRIEPVVDYRFNSREGRDLIRLVAQQQGLKEHLPFSVESSLGAALMTPVFFAVWGLVALISKIFGFHL